MESGELMGSPWDGRQAGDAQVELYLLIVWGEEQEDHGSQWPQKKPMKQKLRQGKEAEFQMDWFLGQWLHFRLKAVLFSLWSDSWRVVLPSVWCHLWPVLKFIHISDAEAEALILWPPDVKRWFIGKDPDAGKDWEQEEKQAADEKVGWHHWLNGLKFEHTQGDSERQRILERCSSWGCKELDMT